MAFVEMRKELTCPSVNWTCFKTEQNKVMSVPSVLISRPAAPSDVAKSYNAIESLTPQQMTPVRLASAATSAILFVRELAGDSEVEFRVESLLSVYHDFRDV